MSFPATTCMQKFFNTPKLVCLIAEYLPPSGISNLCRTSRQLRQWFEPYLFRSITSLPDYGHLRSLDFFLRPEFLNRLSKYTTSVRFLQINTVDRAQLYNGLLSYHHQQQQQQQTPSTTTINKPLPTWLPPLNDLYFPHLPLAPMTNLTVLERNIWSIQRSEQFPCLRPTNKNIFSQFLQLCWILQLHSASLVKLTTDYLQVRGIREVWLLAETIAGILRLKQLDIMIGINALSAFEVWKAFVLSAPESLESIAVTVVLNGGNGKDVNEGGEQAMVVERPLERELLPGLKKLTIPPLTADFTLENIQGILERCPNLVGLSTSTEWDFDIPEEDQDALVAVVAGTCHKLKTLAYDAGNHEESTFSFIHEMMTLLPESQVEEVEYDRFSSTLDFGRATLGISRHLTTLRKATFNDCRGSLSPIIGFLLKTCVGLEELSCTESTYVHLDDAVIPFAHWACTKIQTLNLIVARNAFRDGKDQYFNTVDLLEVLRTSTWEYLTEDRREQIKQLEQFHEQLEVLSMLKSKKLRTVIIDADGRVNYSRYPRVLQDCLKDFRKYK
ncbi:hypothetical protein BGZ88_002388 [Linnemannia elongata]|nr:hypothetical protein BGZ88_002388 [Linnemannia elongata]